jgi:hypothetical protein
MVVNLNDSVINFNVISIEIRNRNQGNVFENNLTKDLNYRLNKAIRNNNDRLNKIADSLKQKYNSYLHLPLGQFLIQLKNEGNLDYKLFLNKYGDNLFCNFSISNYENDKGIYCYIVNDEIVYVGRSKKPFGKRFKDYGRITPYNCLIDGQATNCNINSKVNQIQTLEIGFYIMNSSTDKEIEKLEIEIIEAIKDQYDLWNIQNN